MIVHPVEDLIIAQTIAPVVDVEIQGNLADAIDMNLAAVDHHPARNVIETKQISLQTFIKKGRDDIIYGLFCFSLAGLKLLITVELIVP